MTDRLDDIAHQQVEEHKGGLELVRDELKEESPIREAIEEAITAVDKSLDIHNPTWVPRKNLNQTCLKDVDGT